MLEIFQYSFMQNALFAALLASIACGLIGTFIVVRKLVFITGGIAHISFGGIGLGYFLGINPLLTAIPFGVLSSIFIGVLSKKTKISEDSAVGVLWALGMALGILLIYLTPGYAPGLFTYLFGNILAVPLHELQLMAGLDAIICLSVFGLFKELRAVSFDEEFSEAAGLPTNRIYLFLLALISLSIILLIKSVGIILVLAMLTIPALISKNHTKNLKAMMGISILIGVFFSLLGLGISYLFNLPSGAVIILLLGGAFFLSAAFKKML